MNSYTKLLTDLVNVDVEIDEEYKAVILLNSLPREEYETFTPVSYTHLTLPTIYSV